MRKSRPASLRCATSGSAQRRPPGRPRRWRGGTALAATLVALFALCSAVVVPQGLASGAQPSITLYSGQHVQTTDALVARFEKKTGITVNVRSGTEDTLVNQIVTEGGRSPADVIYTENSPALEYLQSKKLLARVRRRTLAKTQRTYDSPRGDWVGVSARVSVLIYNPSLIAKRRLPRSVLQLAARKYRGKLAFAAGETDLQPIVTAVDDAYGRAKTVSWLKGVEANVVNFTHTYTSDETVAEEVNRGEVAFGIVNQYYWYRMRAQIGRSNVHSKITYFKPHDPGYVIDVSGAAVLRSSKHKTASQRFLSFLVSKPAQRIIANPTKSMSFEYPIDSGVRTKSPEKPFARLKPYPISVGKLGDGRTAISLLKDAGFL